MAQDKKKQRIAQMRHYHRNKMRYADALNKRRIERSKWWAEYKILQHFVCKHCGEDHPACICFHHRDVTTKKRGVSELVSAGYPIKTILREIEKCDVLCHNCHAKHHWQCDKRRRNISDTQYMLTPLAPCKPRYVAMSKTCRHCYLQFDVKPSKQNRQYCSQLCYRLASRKVVRPSREELNKLLWSVPTIKIANDYGVDSKSVTWWAKQYGLQKPPRGYWQQLKAEQ